MTALEASHFLGEIRIEPAVLVETEIVLYRFDMIAILSLAKRSSGEPGGGAGIAARVYVELAVPAPVVPNVRPVLASLLFCMFTTWPYVAAGWYFDSPWEGPFFPA
jgi:hypothetical protein